MEELMASLTSPDLPIVEIKVPPACTDQSSKDVLAVKLCECSNKKWCSGWKMFREICKQEGAKLCVSTRFHDAKCVILHGRLILRGRKGTVEYQSPKIDITNVTFYDKANTIVETVNWFQYGNVSVLHMKPVIGIPEYHLSLEPDVSGKNQSTNCTTTSLKGDTEETPSLVTFTAHWHQEVTPGCTYKTYFMPKNHCGVNTNTPHEKQLPPLQYEHSSQEQITLSSNNGMIYAEMGTLAVVFLLILSLILANLHQRKKRRKSSRKTQSKDKTLNSEWTPFIPHPTRVLLVYPPHLNSQITELSTKLKEMTGLQIEDLYDVTDQDKLNDPTVWLTRRLMDADTRFVLACPSSALPGNQDPQGEQEESVFLFLHEHFLQHLHSSNLSHDYTRLHLVRFDDQGQEDMTNVTPGRLYQLPDHLHQLAQNLTIGPSHPNSTNPSIVINSPTPLPSPSP